MSSFLTCPRTPVPATLAGLTPDSLASRAAPGARVVFCDCAAGCGAAAAVAGLAAAVAAPSSRVARRSPNFTISPLFFTIFESTPDAGAGTSIVTLSVSSSTSMSPVFTCSPGFFLQPATVASEMDSPIGGTLMSIEAAILFSLCEDLVHDFLLFFLMHFEVASGRAWRRRTANVR